MNKNDFIDINSIEKDWEHFGLNEDDHIDFHEDDFSNNFEEKLHDMLEELNKFLSFLTKTSKVDNVNDSTIFGFICGLMFSNDVPPLEGNLLKVSSLLIFRLKNFFYK
jgi:hypothetical protein